MAADFMAEALEEDSTAEASAVVLPDEAFGAPAFTAAFTAALQVLVGDGEAGVGRVTATTEVTPTRAMFGRRTDIVGFATKAIARG